MYEVTANGEPFWNDPEVLLTVLVAVLIADNLWSIFLMLREIRVVYAVQQVPGELRPYLPQTLFETMRANKLHRCWFTLVNRLCVVVILGSLELYLGLYPFIWKLSLMCAIWKWMEHEVVISIVFVILLSTYITIKSLPGAIYDRWCIPTMIKRPNIPWKYRILRVFLDTLLSLFLMTVFVTIVVFVVIALGKYSFLGLYGLALIAMLLVILLLPILIDPFLGNRVPLQNAALKRDLERLTESVGFPFDQVHIIQVHDSSGGSNAFFFGSCCLKRIVIFDTLLLNRGLANTSELRPEEVGKGLCDPLVVAVVGHELGHWAHGHFYKAIIMLKVHLFVTLCLFAICFPHGPIYQAIGFEQGLQPIIVGFLIIFGYVLTPYMTLSNVCMLTMTRNFEYQADKFAFKLGFAASLREALLKLYADNLTFPVSDSCYSSWNHTHPTMLSRIRRLNRLEQES